MNVIITGSRRGIGRATVEKFASNGANIWACARKADRTFEYDMAALSAKYGVEITPVYFDLTDDSAIKAGIKRIIQEKTPIDVLINNAGYMPAMKSVGMTSLEEVRQVLQANTVATVLITQLVSRQMLRSGKGAIINVASTAGLEAADGYSAYAMSKAALISFTQTCAAELAPNNIRVNAVAPGLTDTELGLSLHPKATEHALNKARMGRMGTIEEVANVIFFLAGEDASFITGQVIRVDGGSL